MDALLQLISELFGNLVGNLIDHKQIDWGMWFRLLSVGFFGVSILILIFSLFEVDQNLTAVICCVSPFILTGLFFLIIELIRQFRHSA